MLWDNKKLAFGRRVGAERMKKMYTYFCLFFTGSLLPFLIVEWYFQEYFALGVLALLASGVLTVCLFLDYLRMKVIRWSALQRENTEYSDWESKKENAEGTSVYYFRNFL
jgi:hypothetical protein